MSVKFSFHYHCQDLTAYMSNMTGIL